MKKYNNSYNNYANNSTNKKNKKKSNKPAFTHFIMYPLEEESFKNSYISMAQKIKDANIINLDLLQTPQKLHITLTVLELPDLQTEEKVTNILKEIQPDLFFITNNSMQFCMEKFDSFQNLEECRMLFAKAFEDENFLMMSEVNNLIISKLIQENIIVQKDFDFYHITQEKGKYVINPHLTLLNNSFLKHKEKEKKFNAKEIISLFDEDFRLPDCKINKIKLCRMKSDENGEYETVSEISI